MKLDVNWRHQTHRDKVDDRREAGSQMDQIWLTLKLENEQQ